MRSATIWMSGPWSAEEVRLMIELPGVRTMVFWLGTHSGGGYAVCGIKDRVLNF